MEEKKFALEMQGAGWFSPRPCSSWPNFFYGKRQRPLTTSRNKSPQTPTLSAGEKSPSCRDVTTAADPRDFSPCLPGEGRSPGGTFGGAVGRFSGNMKKSSVLLSIYIPFNLSMSADVRPLDGLQVYTKYGNLYTKYGKSIFGSRRHHNLNRKEIHHE